MTCWEDDHAPHIQGPLRQHIRTVSGFGMTRRVSSSGGLLGLLKLRSGESSVSQILIGVSAPSADEHLQQAGSYHCNAVVKILLATRVKSSEVYTMALRRCRSQNRIDMD